MNYTYSIIAWGQCGTRNSWIRESGIIEALESRNFTLLPENSQKVDLLIFFDFSIKDTWKLWKLRKIKKRALITVEPKSVNPWQHKRLIRALFSKVFVTSPLHVQHIDDFYFDWYWEKPYVENLSMIKWGLRQSKIALLNANKFSFSKTSLYKSRTKLVKKFLNLGFSVDVAGDLWRENIWTHFFRQLKRFIFSILNFEVPYLKNFYFPLKSNPKLQILGKVGNTHEFYNNYKFALVVENDSKYISEKLFNAIESGCLPLYLGPKLELFKIPNEVALSIKDVDLENFSFYLSQNTYTSQILEAGKKWLDDPATRHYWSIEAMVTRLSSEIYKLTENSNGKLD